MGGGGINLVHCQRRMRKVLWPQVQQVNALRRMWERKGHTNDGIEFFAS
jgi:hypothetical protein